MEDLQSSSNLWSLPEGNFAAFRASLERSFGPGEMLEEQTAGARGPSRFRY